MQRYYETRRLPHNPPSTLAADIARHIEMRQYLGTTLVVCDNPTATLSATRKQWLKATRNLQRMRASTLNPEEILRLTHAIMHMQNMDFVMRSPTDQPHANVFFLTPQQLAHIPFRCYSAYITTPLSHDAVLQLVTRLPNRSLIVDYTDMPFISSIGLQSKINLEHNITKEWRNLSAFLHDHGIDPNQLIVGNILQFTAMDDALDILLGSSEDFLERSARFQRILNLGQPFTIIARQQQKYFEAVTRLAHRVQALTPGDFNNYLEVTFGDAGAEFYFLCATHSELYFDLEFAARCEHPPE
ncbi:MAG TPA: hypothetical protein VLG40_01850 [Candidatus Saccharimonas sp.]|nr:hypothetical protein [Candidatus Saccharimonas sp.]